MSVASIQYNVLFSTFKVGQDFPKSGSRAWIGLVSEQFAQNDLTCKTGIYLCVPLHSVIVCAVSDSNCFPDICQLKLPFFCWTVREDKSNLIFHPGNHGGSANQKLTLIMLVLPTFQDRWITASFVRKAAIIVVCNSKVNRRVTTSLLTDQLFQKILRWQKNYDAFKLLRFMLGICPYLRFCFLS